MKRAATTRGNELRLAIFCTALLLTGCDRSTPEVEMTARTWRYYVANPGEIAPMQKICREHPKAKGIMMGQHGLINWANDANLDGAMDGMDKIKSVTTGLTSRGEISNTGINFSDVSQPVRLNTWV